MPWMSKVLLCKLHSRLYVGEKYPYLVALPFSGDLLDFCRFRRLFKTFCKDLVVTREKNRSLYVWEKTRRLKCTLLPGDLLTVSDEHGEPLAIRVGGKALSMRCDVRTWQDFLALDRKFQEFFTEQEAADEQ